MWRWKRVVRIEEQSGEETTVGQPGGCLTRRSLHLRAIIYMHVCTPVVTESLGSILVIWVYRLSHIRVKRTVFKARATRKKVPSIERWESSSNYCATLLLRWGWSTKVVRKYFMIHNTTGCYQFLRVNYKEQESVPSIWIPHTGICFSC